MKRGGPIQRRTPLPRGGSLSRSEIRKRRPAARRRSRNQEHGVPWPDVRLAIWVRSGGRCEGCGRTLSIAAMEGHHRLSRRYGPDCTCNALALCSDCHHTGTHQQPAAALEAGRIVSKHDTRPPGDVPVAIHGRGVVLLTCDGTYKEQRLSDGCC